MHIHPILTILIGILVGVGASFSGIGGGAWSRSANSASSCWALVFQSIISAATWSLADSMSAYLSGRLEADPRIRIRTRTEVAALEGADALTGIRLQGAGVAPGDDRIDSRALFVMVGAAPNTEWLNRQVDCDAKGFLLTGEAVGRDSPFATSLDGVFAVGDVRAGSVKRVASSVGEGSVVISKVWEHVAAQRDREAGRAAAQ